MGPVEIHTWLAENAIIPELGDNFWKDKQNRIDFINENRDRLYELVRCLDPLKSFSSKDMKLVLHAISQYHRILDRLKDELADGDLYRFEELKASSGRGGQELYQRIRNTEKIAIDWVAEQFSGDRYTVANFFSDIGINIYIIEIHILQTEFRKKMKAELSNPDEELSLESEISKLEEEAQIIEQRIKNRRASLRE